MFISSSAWGIVLISSRLSNSNNSSSIYFILYLLNINSGGILVLILGSGVIDSIIRSFISRTSKSRYIISI